MEPFIGQVMMFAGNFAPRGWALCDGQLLSISQHSALFSILGTTYGGDGVSTFALPDMRCRVPIHVGTGPGLTPQHLGERSGVETVTLSVNQMPTHNHQVSCLSTQGNLATPQGNYLGGDRTGGDDLYSNTANASMNSQMIEPAGESQPVNLMQPSLCVNFVIALDGIYPSRS